MVITNEDGWLKRSYSHGLVRPQFAVMNPELTFTLPPFQTACGISDMLAHIMERYFTTVRNVDVSDRMCEAVMRSIMINAQKVIFNPDNYDARAEIICRARLRTATSSGLGESAIGRRTISNTTGAQFTTLPTARACHYIPRVDEITSTRWTSHAFYNLPCGS